MLYAGDSFALCCLEVLVHLDKTEIPSDYVWAEAEIRPEPESFTFDRAPAEHAPLRPLVGGFGPGIGERFRYEVFRCLDRGRMSPLREVWVSLSYAAIAEQLRNEERLTECIAFDHPSRSPFPDHIHRLDALQCPPRTLKRAVPFGQPDTLF